MEVAGGHVGNGGYRGIRGCYHDGWRGLGVGATYLLPPGPALTSPPLPWSGDVLGQQAVKHLHLPVYVSVQAAVQHLQAHAGLQSSSCTPCRSASPAERAAPCPQCCG
ncbi:hypothetical protein GDO81_006530 [Engystomops pustulosus]|uniref:Uncharacterized protein n=1 Tax=Engystomops pustulosus TaxID=76066 RepID=A0AAV7CYY4_ENGPU|nr:hypothetical protein GDO81_006530 [Engystomops pustulosus]